ncbi:30S ribosomal protein S5 [Candidatus Aerophobetes bacterium]|uniref:Small ribosomal subunit protein uS5 n=1 Tax=Aerophobetes bacterium TaxID=2030807 RepID=A0A2A4X758_UNCAE|nr:MAG: 30S ribosomal protein S5 [Candidatus Aerophobetes bacterium]
MAKEAVKDKKEDDLEEKVLYINRCSKVVKGGRTFSFSALIVVGDGAGKVGVGFGKANEVSDAIRKASGDARKNLEQFVMQETSIPHEINVKFDGAQVLLKPAKLGTGIIAGSLVRSVLEVAGVKDVVAKNLGSNNPFNMVRATIKALFMMRNRKETLNYRNAS